MWARFFVARNPAAYAARLAVASFAVAALPLLLSEVCRACWNESPRKGSHRAELIMSNWTEVLELVSKARAGDRAAYGDLVARFQPAIYAIALSKLRNPAEAQELTQEVFIH